MPPKHLLTTKNTFVDCKSPWLEQVEVAEKPSSDPGPCTESSATFSGSSERVWADVMHVVVRSSPAETSAPEGPAESSRAAEEAEGSRRESLSRTQRRRLQRKNAQYAASGTSPASSSARGSDPRESSSSKESPVNEQHVAAAARSTQYKQRL
ncbi:unnamed protein product [Prorocentrum cordatum]|uniref:Uncharacterized protein n=1 Tax=Prorocentrum cordatum TaxID=2364126 RepID=A0ABN9WLB8_9DINO|nr:unnamed protein product [Polarella glacialis]CAK0887386.1 unnamed protein product [Polarella glacialis]